MCRSHLGVKGTGRAERLTAAPWKEPRGSAPWRKFRIRRAVDVAPKFFRRLRTKVRRRVHVGLATDNHTDVRMQIYSTRFAGHKSEMRACLVLFCATSNNFTGLDLNDNHVPKVNEVAQCLVPQCSLT